jgi:hypothetical protein
MENLLEKNGKPNFPACIYTIYALAAARLQISSSIAAGEETDVTLPGP